MPTAKLFGTIPPFPNDVPTASLPLVSFTKLLSGDDIESSRLFQACRAAGFVQLNLNGSAEGEALLAEAETLFEINREVNDLSLEEKMKYAFKPPNLFGYKHVGSMKTESGQPDRYEFYNTAQDDILGNAPPRANPLPIENNRGVIKSYLLRAYKVLTVILSHLENHLNLPAGAFTSLQRQDTVSGTAVRMLRYDPQPDGDRRTSLLGHTDIGTVTLLFNVVGGLQILPPGVQNTEENWRYVRPEPGCALVNLGDAMVEWSGGILRSNIHRVTYAPGAQKDSVRYSLAYLVRPGANVPMKRLAGGGSLVPQADDGEEELNCDAAAWEAKRAAAIISGKGFAMSRGGREIAVQ